MASSASFTDTLPIWSRIKNQVLFGVFLIGLALPAVSSAQSADPLNPYGYRPYTTTQPAQARSVAPVTPMPVYTPPAPIRSAGTAPVVVGQDGHYLGRLNNNPYDPNSVSNPYGRYGSPYSADSVNNPYGKYGSPYSSLSATNPYATQAPQLIAPDSGQSLGRLSANPYAPDSTSNPYGRAGSPYSPSSINNPYGKYYAPPRPDRDR
jgi:hypothetical protein